MKIDTDSTNTDPRIDLTPMIDVIFCILTFFLLAGLQVSRQQAIGVDIPKAASGTPSARELIMVTLNDAGQIFLEKQPMVSPAQLVEAVKQYRLAKPNSSIVLYAAKQVSYNNVVEVLDVLRGVAGDRVALATIPTDSVAPTPPLLPNPAAGYGDPTQPYNPSQPAPGSVAPNPYQPAPVAPQFNPAPIPQPTPGVTPR